ncbi:MAG: 2-hydroxychromene-2-carboxylate isomerase [Burkholderiaceae bacterium]
MARIECFFDCSSPWTYLCVHNLPPLAEKYGATITWRPILVGGVFNSVNPSVYAARENPVPAKAAYSLKIMQDWARVAGINMNFPPSIFPVNSVKAMRACLWLEHRENNRPGDMLAFARLVFEAYFGQDKDISSTDELAAIASQLGIETDSLLAGISEQSIKNRLRENTDELVARGGFGSPTLFVDDSDMYFGNDALPLVRATLARKL